MIFAARHAKGVKFNSTLPGSMPPVVTIRLRGPVFDGMTAEENLSGGAYLEFVFTVFILCAFEYAVTNQPKHCHS